MSKQNVDASQEIVTGREEIDVIDEQILDLIDRRAMVSRRIQAARIESGETRIEHARENVVIRRYQSRLGRSGTVVIMAILEMCRGKVGAVFGRRR
ncbi:MULTISPECIES: chorismate mutase [Actinoalloteichus]|uniref:chorismate mutase n=1 Tax=Actinoalloteichus TaxID=65496 RepID=UPI0004AAA302|nr:chorismate mutase [Actinoalloteichus caeruleus]